MGVNAGAINWVLASQLGNVHDFDFDRECSHSLYLGLKAGGCVPVLLLNEKDKYNCQVLVHLSNILYIQNIRFTPMGT